MKSNIFIAPPPGFTGLNQHKEITRYERNLPHWRQEGATYFVTFRLADSLPQTVLRELKSQREIFTKKLQDKPNLAASEIDKLWREFSHRTTAKTERSLDQGFGSCILKNIAVREAVTSSLNFYANKRYEIGAFVVMPNHVHALIRPIDDFKLEFILQSIKRHTSRTANRLMHTEGSLWQEESYDRIIRDTDHLSKCVQYIGNNPRKSNLGTGEKLRWISPDWKKCGWEFHDAKY